MKRNYLLNDETVEEESILCMGSDKEKVLVTEHV